jgi:hypothetical protein
MRALFFVEVMHFLTLLRAHKARTSSQSKRPSDVFMTIFRQVKTTRIRPSDPQNLPFFSGTSLDMAALTPSEIIKEMICSAIPSRQPSR